MMDNFSTFVGGVIFQTPPPFCTQMKKVSYKLFDETKLVNMCFCLQRTSSEIPPNHNIRKLAFMCYSNCCLSIMTANILRSNKADKLLDVAIILHVPLRPLSIFRIVMKIGIGVK